MTLALVLELSHAAEFAELCAATEDPAQHRVSGDVALNEKYRLFRVDTASHEQSVSRKGVLAEFSGILPYCDSVHIGNTVNAVVFFLKRTPVSYSADVVAEGESTCRLNGTENEFFIFHCGMPPYFALAPKA